VRHAGVVIQVTRQQVLARRQEVHGLAARSPRLTDLAVLDLGVQNTPPGALIAALSARLGTPLTPDADLTGGGARTTQRGGKLDVAVTRFRPFADAEWAAVAVEAERLGVVRGASQVVAH
jgi:hypothetical protein